MLDCIVGIGHSHRARRSVDGDVSVLFLLRRCVDGLDGCLGSRQYISCSLLDWCLDFWHIDGSIVCMDKGYSSRCGTP